MSLETPVLYLFFNRPELCQVTFSKIREARPMKLFLAADGPRADRPEDALKCRKARDVVLSSIDWECDVYTLFREQNLGCGVAVSEGISWFFSHVERGIILEDDCMANRAFFPFCEKFLAIYEDEPEVMHISGNNFVPNARFSHDVDFSKYCHSWGWATWASAWANYSYQLPDVAALMNSDEVDFLNERARRYWVDTFLRTQRGAVDTWDYQWLFCVWKRSGLALVPKYNLVRNVGFGDDATHTSSGRLYSQLVYRDAVPCSWPRTIVRNPSLDDGFYNLYLSGSHRLRRAAQLHVSKLRNWVHRRSS